MSLQSYPLRAKALLELRRRKSGQQSLPLLEWTQTHRQMLARGRQFNIQRHLYLEAIYRDDCQEMVLQKAGQVGISEYLVSWTLWSCDVRDCNALYLFPNDGLVSDFSSARIGPAISSDVSPYLAGIMSGGVGMAGQGVDRVGLKQVRNRHLYLRGAMVKSDGRAPQLKSIDADILVLDEYDEMQAAVEAMARERLGHSPVADVRIASTPTYPTVGISRLYKTTDQRQWFVRCDECGNRQTLELTDLVQEFDDLDRPVRWHADEDGPYLACRKCGEKLNRLAPGEWVATHPERAVHGYHLSRLFMAHKPLTDIIDGLHSIDEFRRQQTYNQGLGLPYRSPTSLALTPGDLDGCIRSEKEPSAGRTYMGVDIGRVLHIVIRSLAKSGSLAQEWIGEVPEFEDLDPLINRYNVFACVVDALPETRKAREFQRRFSPGKVWLAYYVDSKKTDPSEAWDIRESTVNADRTRTLDTTLVGFRSAARGEPGKTLLPSIRANPDYYTHLCALERVLRRKADGETVAVYVGDPDHYGHAENYCDIASRCIMAGGWSRGPGR